MKPFYADLAKDEAKVSGKFAPMNDEEERKEDEQLLASFDQATR